MMARQSEKFNILRQSPLDRFQAAGPPIYPEAARPPAGTVPSRFNVQATAEDGRLILWNTYSGALSVFPADQKAHIRALLSRTGQMSQEGAAEYLRSRGFLIQKDVDELRRFQYAFGQQQYRTDTLELTLLTSEDCNFRCRYCYEKFARGTMQPWVREAIKRLVEKRLPSLQTLGISWFGGEPLYGFEAIEDLAPFFDRVAQEHSLRYSSHMSTNGYLLNSEVAEKLLTWGIRSYQITVDGVPEDHNRSRPTREGGRTFDVILANLRGLHRRDDPFAVDIRVNFDKENRARLHRLLDLLAVELGGDPRFKLRFRPVGRWGGAQDEDLDVWTHTESTEVINDLTRQAAERALNSCDALTFNNHFGSQVCYAARPYNFVIGSTGTAMKCTVALDTKSENIVGHLSPEGDLVLDTDKMSKWTEPSFERDSKCQSCVILPLCQGISCPLVRIEQKTSPCVPLRMNLKTELLQVNKSSRRRARTVHGTPATP